MSEQAVVEKVKYDAQGLVTVIAQDAESGEVLMVAYMNQEALRRTLETRQATYWSRSRQEFWVKGASSGHLQHVEEVRLDCDQDCVLLKVRQEGAACHAGYRSCFYRAVSEDGSALETVEERIFDPDEVYSKT